MATKQKRNYCIRLNCCRTCGQLNLAVVPVAATSEDTSPYLVSCWGSEFQDTYNVFTMDDGMKVAKQQQKIKSREVTYRLRLRSASAWLRLRALRSRDGTNTAGTYK